MIHGKRGLLVRLCYLFTAILYFYINKVIRCGNQDVIVLVYHGVNRSQKEKFAKQMQMIYRRAVSERHLCKPRRDRGKRLLVCVTFDDAYANLLDNVIPIITELKIPITIFISTGSIGTFPSWLQGVQHTDSTEMVLSAKEVFKLNKNPKINFGSHTVTHPRLSHKTVGEIREEICVSRKVIQEMTGNNIQSLALPHGDYNSEVLSVAFEEGYRNIFTLDPTVYSCKFYSVNNRIGRFSMSPDAWSIEFYLAINGAYTWLYAWRNFAKRTLGFIQRLIQIF